MYVNVGNSKQVLSAVNVPGTSPEVIATSMSEITT